MTIEQLSNKKILILGYGKEGKVTEQYLKRMVPTSSIVIADKNDGTDYLQKQYDCDIVVRSPGIHKDLITVPSTTATNIFFSQVPATNIIGVTGSKGKSTTASLIYAILREAGITTKLIGNIGSPALEALLEGQDPETMYVYELSSYQLDDIEYSPHIAVLTTLFPEHMNYHKSLSSYYEAKKRIIAKSTEKDYFVFNPENTLLQSWSKETKANVVPFETDYLPKTIPLMGEHNMSNVRAAITVARILKIKDNISSSAIAQFKPLPHRLECVGTFDDITFYDDAISTSPESTIAALRAIKGVKTILLGGENRGYDYAGLAQELAALNITNVVLFPDSGAAIGEELKKHMPALPHVLQTATMEEAVSFAYKMTPKGSVCLLSTAAPSYSLWKNFEQKGDQFQLYVRRLAHGQTSSENHS